MGIDEFIDRLSALMAGKSSVTVKKTQDSLRLLKKLCNVTLISGIGRDVVMDFRAKRLNEDKVKPATVNKDLRQIKSAMSYAVDAGMLRSNPLLRWKQLMLREPEKELRVVERDEFNKLLEQCENPSLRALLVVAYCQGLRRKELANLRWTAVDLKSEVLHVLNIAEDGELTKSRKNRCIPLHPDALTELAALHAEAPKVVQSGAVRPKATYVFTWPDGQPYKPDWLTHEFGRLVKKAGIVHCTLHDLRRSFSTLAQRAGVDKYTVKDLGGWSVVSVVEKHYTGDLLEAHRKAMQRIARTA
ncbi:MAG: tyrosine-type recombinase/integrase [bacterium]|nr:tyrosine-type recombinase/integrase [bacterium]